MPPFVASQVTSENLNKNVLKKKTNTLVNRTNLLSAKCHGSGSPSARESAGPEQIVSDKVAQELLYSSSTNIPAVVY